MSLSPRVYNKGMAFSEEIVLEAWKRSGERCECQRENHGHRNGRCGQSLTWVLRRSIASAGWEAHRRTSWARTSWRIAKSYARPARGLRSRCAFAEGAETLRVAPRGEVSRAPAVSQEGGFYEQSALVGRET